MHDQRIFFSDNGTLTDLSMTLNDFRSGTSVINYTVSQDYLFIGSFLPFNHKYFDVNVANDVTAAISVDIWDGAAWQAAVDIIDRTSVGGKTLAQDGIISWSTDITKVWGRQYKSSQVTGLSGTNIYNMYWIRLSFNATLKATMSLDFVGQKFNTDTDLFSFYPDLNNSSLMTSYASGKTNWNEQAFIATENIIRDLKKDQTIVSADQVLDFDLFKECSCHACAMVIYWGLNQIEKHDKAKTKYDTNFKQGFLRVDLNQDALIEPVERIVSGAKFLTR